MLGAPGGRSLSGAPRIVNADGLNACQLSSNGETSALASAGGCGGCPVPRSARRAGRRWRTRGALLTFTGRAALSRRVSWPARVRRTLPPSTRRAAATGSCRSVRATARRRPAPPPQPWRRRCGRRRRRRGRRLQRRREGEPTSMWRRWPPAFACGSVFRETRVGVRPTGASPALAALAARRAHSSLAPTRLVGEEHAAAGGAAQQFVQPFQMAHRRGEAADRETRAAPGPAAPAPADTRVLRSDAAARRPARSLSRTPAPDPPALAGTRRRRSARRGRAARAARPG